MPKPQFDPSKPFEYVQDKPPFDPNKPFEYVKEEQPDQRSFGQQAAELGRSAFEGATLGLSEPVFSGLQAGIQTAKKASGLSDIIPTLKQEFSADVERRRLAKSQMPLGSSIAEMAGSLVPSPLNVGNVLAKGVSSGVKALPIIGGDAVGYLKSIAQGGLSGALTGVGLESVKQAAEVPTGFIKDEPLFQRMAESAIIGGGIGGGVPAVLGLPGAAIAKGKQFLTTKLGVPQKEIENYLKNPEAVNNAPSVEALRDEVFGVVKELNDKTINAQISAKESKFVFNKLKSDIEIGLREKKLDIKDAAKEAERMVEAAILKAKNVAASDMVQELDKLKSTITKGSEESYAILDKDKNIYDLSLVSKKIRKLANDLNIGDRTKGAPITVESQSAKSKINDLATRLKKAGPELPAKELKKILQQLDQSGQTLYGQPGFDSRVSQAYKSARSEIDQIVKSFNPEYASKMEEVSSNSKLFSEVVNKFGNEVSALSTLNQTTGQNQGPIKELIKKFQVKAGKDYLRYISPESASEYENMIKLKNQVDEVSRPGFFQAKSEEISKLSPEFQAMIESDGLLAQAKATQAPFKSISPSSAGQTTIEQKIKTVLGDRNIETKKMFEDLSKLSDKDFANTIENMRTKLSFEKRFQQGSSNVNLWGALGTVTGSMMGLQGAIGGAAAGAALGKYLDAYGPRTAKQILDQVIKISANPTIQKIQSLALPQNIKEQLAQDLILATQNKTTPNESPMQRRLNTIQGAQ